MNTTKQRLIIEQTDQKLLVFIPLESLIVPQKGWIQTIRIAIKDADKGNIIPLIEFARS